VTVAILLPTLNEERNIGKVIEGLKPLGAEIVVIDGLSTDRTVEIARSLGARIILEPERGKGIAIKRAFREIDADYAIMMDADQTYPISSIPSFLQALRTHEVVSGSRFKGIIAQGSMSFVNSVGNRIICIWASILYMRLSSDICTGMWGFSRKAYKGMEITARGFDLEANLFTEAVKKGYKVKELPILYSRRGGASKIQISDGVRVCGFLLKERFSR
jgi:glycosyltransferase involved in cell wall biosynthesis